ncbi:hypothetical protein D8869_05575 [Streptococcus sanguinis]|uniref:Uncharacterized conserved protein n=1 Tax=Streptococcus sanguinis TaxID=1305 RepID=A0A2X3Y2T4_STRSA|nr:DUF262 domain-containing protein [Streptococcus sanguinis]RSI06916.1 hypothetical protein D8888_10605 [Streptococcus sanguinis]RSI15121.1 hypothetical protein D8885_01405 [Streptococcus sanguinis]RSI44686.1 hypothetical protein D8873_08645 [Streptococcus sanguinis]RSI52925.1 hypothetical protein D8869_05575 [Streptococcus sanguinis]RSI66070.1 hypothetical protein D8861_07615 [Streptococcus sanguinis]
MVETHISLSVNRLLNEDSYAIPLYQRNFAWTYDEIEQLLNDVADAFQEKRENYYIGTLVVNEENGIFKIIDGQQRTTALNLIALALKHEFGFNRLNAVNLTFPARKKSNENIQKLFTKQKISENDENELTRGYRHAYDALKKVLEERQFESQSFFNYLFDKVIIFRSLLPNDLDLNLYFERFNSRGEQLEAHEILKAQMMDKFGEDQEMAQKFARIWDACSEFDKPVLKAFQIRSRPNNPDEEGEKIFGREYANFKLQEVFDKIGVDKVETKSLLEAISEDKSERGRAVSKESDISNYTTVIDFPTFLFQVFFIMEGSNETTFDDKKLLKIFEIERRDREWVQQFGQLLLTIKHIFDTLIVKNAQLENETEWQIKCGQYETYQRNENGGWKYVRINFQKNTFDNLNKNIILLQSMFAVTFTANRDSRWLYEILQFLFNHIEELNDQEFGAQFKDFLEKMAVRYAEERLFAEDGSIKKYGDIPVYAFNFVDYVLWKNRAELEKEYKDIKFDNFKFAYRRSIEHWFPQNPNGHDGESQLPAEFLHSFGNLCIITDSQNSKFGNSYPESKLTQWKREDIFKRQSLKLQIMAAITEKTEWKSDQVLGLENEIMPMVSKFIENKK